MVDAKDKEGYKIFYFPTPPKCVETVDVYFSSYSNKGFGDKHYILINKDINITEI
jgi:hypothetical protein